MAILMFMYINSNRFLTVSENSEDFRNLNGQLISEAILYKAMLASMHAKMFILFCSSCMFLIQ